MDYHHLTDRYGQLYLSEISTAQNCMVPRRSHSTPAPYVESGGGGATRAGQAEPAPITCLGGAEAPKSRVDEVHREATPKAPLTLEGRPRTQAPPPPPDTPLADLPNTLISPLTPYRRSPHTAAHPIPPPFSPTTL